MKQTRMFAIDGEELPFVAYTADPSGAWSMFVAPERPKADEVRCPITGFVRQTTRFVREDGTLIADVAFSAQTVTFDMIERAACICSEVLASPSDATHRAEWEGLVVRYRPRGGDPIRRIIVVTPSATAMVPE